MAFEPTAFHSRHAVVYVENNCCAAQNFGIMSIPCGWEAGFKNSTCRRLVQKRSRMGRPAFLGLCSIVSLCASVIGIFVLASRGQHWRQQCDHQEFFFQHIPQSFSSRCGTKRKLQALYLGPLCRRLSQMRARRKRSSLARARHGQFRVLKSSRTPLGRYSLHRSASTERKPPCEFVYFVYPNYIQHPMLPICPEGWPHKPKAQALRNDVAVPLVRGCGKQPPRGKVVYPPERTLPTHNPGFVPANIATFILKVRHHSL